MINTVDTSHEDMIVSMRGAARAPPGPGPLRGTLPRQGPVPTCREPCAGLGWGTLSEISAVSYGVGRRSSYGGKRERFTTSIFMPRLVSAHFYEAIHVLNSILLYTKT